MRTAVVVTTLAAALLAGAPTSAQRLQSNDYVIDFHRGPVLGPGRAVGLSGAYTSLVDGVDGASFNPAGYGVRSTGSLAWFNPDFVLSLNFPQQNWDNSGSAGRSYDNFVVAQLGVGLHFGEVGFGYLGTLENYTLAGRIPGERTVDITVGTHHLGFGMQFGGGEVVLGAGLRVGSLSMRWSGGVGADATAAQLNFLGASPEVGAVWRPVGRRFRLGMSFRPEVVARSIELPDRIAGVRRAPDGCTDMEPGCFVIPRSMNLPWEFELGGSVVLGELRFNERWENLHTLRDEFRARQLEDRALRARRHHADIEALTDPAERTLRELEWQSAEAHRQEHEEAEDQTFEWRWRAEQRARWRDRPRRYVLISAGVVLYGPVGRGVGMDAFVSQLSRSSGRQLLASPRLGVETEPWSNRLVLRAGAYIEPSRFEDVGPRWHVTAGVELRLFRWNVFKIIDPVDLKLTFTMDFSTNYTDWGFGVGFWR